MEPHKAEPWFIQKRAQAYVFSLLAERGISVREPDKAENGVDLFLDLRNGDTDVMRPLAVQLLGFLKFPSVSELTKKVARRIGRALDDRPMLPFVTFAVQVQELDASYAWLNEPHIEEGKAILRSSVEYHWQKLDDGAMDHILDKVKNFWHVLLRNAMKPPPPLPVRSRSQAQ